MNKINELSKKTLGSYMKKAHRSFSNARFDDGVSAGRIGVGQARTKTTSTDGEDDYTKNHRSFKTAMKREKGMATAVKKLTKEETEINELSKKTLGSYIKKASNSAALHHGNVIAARKDADQASSISNGLGLDTPSHVRQKAADVIRSDARERENHNFKKVFKRIKGVEKATDKLTKEDIEMKELITLAENKNIVDFKEAIGGILAEKIKVRFLPEETKEELTLESFLDEVGFTAEELEEAIENLSEEDFDQLSEDEQEIVLAYLELTESDEEEVEEDDTEE